MNAEAEHLRRDLPCDPTLHEAQARSTQELMHLFRRGFLFASPGRDTHVCRVTATMILATTEKDFTVRVAGGPAQTAGVVLLRPGIDRWLMADKVPYLCLDLYPIHSLYRAFVRIPDPGMMVLPRDAVPELAELLPAFFEQPENFAPAYQLFRVAVAQFSALLPPVPPLDARVVKVMELLMQQPASTVAQLASAACLSEGRLSHLFTKEVGVSLRKYLQGMKVAAAAKLYGSGYSMKDIAMAAGFSDASHFSKVWVQSFGISPVHLFNRDAVTLAPRPPLAMPS